jgi:hypothetical protein
MLTISYKNNHVLTLQLMLGDITEAHMHFAGLNTMVDSRRGVRMLGYQGLIARLVKW